MLYVAPISLLAVCVCASVIDAFRAGRTTVLIATNVLARGIDVPATTLVVNYEIPLNKYRKPDYEVRRRGGNTTHG